MKILVLILVLAISIQPLQAGFCDMDMGKSQETPQQMDGAADTGHDCCDTDQPDKQQDNGCDGMGHCAPCHVSTPVIPATATLQVARAPQHAETMLHNLTPANHPSPPFRPPIS